MSQAVPVLCAAVVDVPAAQAVGDATPVLQKKPAGHGVHAEVEAPPTEYEPFGHEASHALVIAPFVVPYLPPAHGWHTALSPPADHQPLTHWAHVLVVPAMPQPAAHAIVAVIVAMTLETCASLIFLEGAVRKTQTVAAADI